MGNTTIRNDKQITAEPWFTEYFTKGNLDVLDELTTHDLVYHSRNGDNSREKMKEFMRWYLTVLQDDQWTLDDLIEQDHKLVVRYEKQFTLNQKISVF